MAAKKRAPISKYLAIAGLIASLSIGSVIAGKWMVTDGELVTEVLDGDSFKIENKQTIRLASLNAPALEFCMGKEAKDALEKKILGKRVLLRDPKTDIYRRILALVYVRRELVNEYMIRNGLAVTTRQTSDESPSIKAANDYARENHLGIYSPDCYQTTPPDPTCTIKGNIDDRSGEKEYLTVDCPDYTKTIIEKNMGEEWFCSESEAKKAGYTKSSSCSR